MVDRRIIFTALALIVFLVSPAIAEESFEGRATIGPPGRFPTGLYGATNLVPPNTLVTVRNLDSGETERIIITDGVDESGIFLVVSPEAADSLSFTASVARVRLTEIRRTGVAAADTAAERPRSPDPDLNPLAGSRSLIDTLPPAYFPDDLAAEPPVDPPDDEPPARPDDPEPPPAVDEPAPRTGVAAGIARTGIGEAREDLERPDPPLPVSRPVEVEHDIVPDGRAALPEVIAEEPASASLEMTRRPPAVAPDVPLAEARPAVEEPVHVAEPAPHVAPHVRDGPVDLAVRSVVNRLPRKDLYPSPAVPDGEVGLRAVSPPVDEGPIVELPAAQPPAVERPALAGLGPLRIVESDFEVVLAEAEPPREQRPEVADLPPARPAEPAPVDVRLAEADPGAEERPDDSLAAAAPQLAPVSAIPAEPRIAEAESADESFDRTEAVPEDALLALEPADFRPPRASMPDRESLLERDEAPPPVEEPEPVLADPRLEDPPAVAERPEPEPEPVRPAEPEPAVVVEEEAPAIEVVADRIDPESYYLQIGAYANMQTARVAVDALGVTYPMAVVPVDREERRLYRVLVGPLERDETGTLLLWLRARGYRDTFIRTGGEL